MQVHDWRKKNRGLWEDVEMNGPVIIQLLKTIHELSANNRSLYELLLITNRRIDELEHRINVDIQKHDETHYPGDMPESGRFTLWEYQSS